MPSLHPLTCPVQVGRCGLSVVGLCVQQLWQRLGIVGQGTLKIFVPQCFGVNNKGFEYFLNFVDFLGPTQEFCPNSPGQLTTGPHLYQPLLAFPAPVKVCLGHLHWSLVNQTRGSGLITVFSLVPLIVMDEHNLSTIPRNQCSPSTGPEQTTGYRKRISCEPAYSWCPGVCL